MDQEITLSVYTIYKPRNNVHKVQVHTQYKNNKHDDTKFMNMSFVKNLQDDWAFSFFVILTCSCERGNTLNCPLLLRPHSHRFCLEVCG